MPRTQEEIMKSWTGNTKPLVSVCCITYNHEEFISQAIDSFLMQETDFSFEILIHDDASSDGTTGIILQYAENYPQIIRPIIQTENQYSKGGLIAPRFLFPKAKGKYIALCEGDDYWTDCTKLQKQTKFLEHHPEYVITYSNCQPFNENGHLDINFGGAIRDASSDELKRAISLYTLTTCFRNVIKEVPLDLMSSRIGDKVIWSLLGEHGKGKYMPDITPAAYRVHAGGIYSKKIKQQRVEMSLITFSALFSHHTRLGNENIAFFFLKKMFIQILKAICLVGLSRIGLSRFLFKESK